MQEKEKRNKRNNGYKKGGKSSVVFIPATPNSESKKKLEEDVKASDIKVKIVENAGISVKGMLQRSLVDIIVDITSLFTFS